MNMPSRMEIRKIDELIPYAKNARTHPPEQLEKLKASLLAFGWVSPVLIDEAGNVIAGHGRIQAAKLAGIEEAPCVLVEHLSEDQRRAYILADNRLAELSGWDQALVSEELQALRGAGLDLSLTGFSEGDVLLTSTDEVIEDECDLTLPETPTAQPGQLWRLGAHRLLCGDATSPPPCAAVRGRRTDGGSSSHRSALWRRLFERRRRDPQRRQNGRCPSRLFAGVVFRGGRRPGARRFLVLLGALRA